MSPFDSRGMLYTGYEEKPWPEHCSHCNRRLQSIEHACEHCPNLTAEDKSAWREQFAPVQVPSDAQITKLALWLRDNYDQGWVGYDTPLEQWQAEARKAYRAMFSD